MARTDRRTLVQQRGIVADAIRTGLVTDNIIHVSVIEKAYRPLEIIGVDEDLKACAAHARITVCGLAFDESPLTRVTKARTIAIRVFVEKVLDSTKSDQIDEMTQLVDDVMESCSSLHYWVRNESARDEHGMPYMFHVLREKSFFSGIFHAMYNVNATRHKEI